MKFPQGAGQHTSDTYGGHKKVLRQTVIGMIGGVTSSAD